MNLRAVAMLPVRVSVAATQATLGLGRLASPDGPLLREGGYASLLDQLARILADERGILGLAHTLADLTAPERPLGRALEPGGLLDRMVDEDGPFIRLLAAGGPLDRQLAEGGSLYRFLEPGGPLDRLLAEEGPLFALLADDGALDRILADGGLLEQLIAADGILEKLLLPGGTLDQLSGAIPELNEAVVVLSGAVEPLGALAGRLPGSRRRALD